MATILRKLTRKSTLNFGQYADMTVQQVIDLMHSRVLRWYYFNSSNITFTDDILDEIRIPAEYHIDKPGKNPELGHKLDEKLDAKQFAYAAHTAEENGESPEKAMTQKAIMIRAQRRKLAWKRYKDFQRADTRWNTKGVLPAINHGHK